MPRFSDVHADYALNHETFNFQLLLEASKNGFAQLQGINGCFDSHSP